MRKRRFILIGIVIALLICGVLVGNYLRLVYGNGYHPESVADFFYSFYESPHGYYLTQGNLYQPLGDRLVVREDEFRDDGYYLSIGVRTWAGTYFSSPELPEPIVKGSSTKYEYDDDGQCIGKTTTHTKLYYLFFSGEHLVITYSEAPPVYTEGIQNAVIERSGVYTGIAIFPALTSEYEVEYGNDTLTGDAIDWALTTTLSFS